MTTPNVRVERREQGSEATLANVRFRTRGWLSLRYRVNQLYRQDLQTRRFTLGNVGLPVESPSREMHRSIGCVTKVVLMMGHRHASVCSDKVLVVKRLLTKQRGTSEDHVLRRIVAVHYFGQDTILENRRWFIHTTGEDP